MKQLKMFSFLRGVVPLVFALLMVAGSIMTASASQGGDWKIVSSPNVANAYNYLQGVAHVPSTNDVWAVGSSRGQSASYIGQTLIEFKD